MMKSPYYQSDFLLKAASVGCHVVYAISLTSLQEGYHFKRDM